MHSKFGIRPLIWSVVLCPVCIFCVCPPPHACGRVNYVLRERFAVEQCKRVPFRVGLHCWAQRPKTRETTETNTGDLENERVRERG